MTDAALVLGMDIGGTNTRMGLVNRQCEAMLVEISSSRRLFASQDPLKALTDTIRVYLDKHNAQPAMICAGLPAVLDHDRRRVYSATNFPGMEGRDIVAVLESELKLPVVIEHDAYYLLAYDMRDFKVERDGCYIGCYFGTGLGNAIFINGKPYVGKNGTASELGHLAVGLSERRCSCGNQGCVEMYSCGKALEKIAAESYPGEAIDRLFTDHGQDAALCDFVRYMGLAVSAEINILDPDGVFLGGGLIQMKDFPREALKQAILRNTRKPYPAENLQLYFTHSGPENGVIGAALEGFRRMNG